MMQATRKRSAFLLGTVSYLVFLGIWTLYVYLNHRYEINDLVEGILGIGDLIFLLSSAVFLLLFHRRLHLGVREMFTTLPKPKVFLPLLGIILAYYAVSMLLTHGKFYLDPSESVLRLFFIFVIVGVEEELLFRGCFLNLLASAMSERKANLLSGVFFMAIHFPSYWMSHASPDTWLYSGGLFLLGIVFGWSFRKSRSIWTPILLHMIWDILSRLVF